MHLKNHDRWSGQKVCMFSEYIVMCNDRKQLACFLNTVKQYQYTER